MARLQLEHVFDASPIGLAVVGLDGRFLQVNRAVCAMLGRTDAELLATDFQAVTFPADLPVDLAHRDAVLEGSRRSYQMEKRYVHRTGRVIWAQLNVSLVRDARGKPLHFVSHVQEIDARRRTERHRAMTVEVLDILNRIEAPTEAATRVVEIIRREIGVDSASIRLAGDGGFPYSAHVGLPEELSPTDPIEPDLPAGRPPATIEALQPLSTPGGSIWTNDATSFTSPSGDPRPPTHEAPDVSATTMGYRSVALVPIRSGEDFVGLLQLSDRRPDQFSAEIIAYLEEVCDSVGLALARKQAKDALRDSEQKFSAAFVHAPMLMTLTDTETEKLVDANVAFFRTTGFTRKEAIGHSATEIGWAPAEVRTMMIERLRADGVVSSLQVEMRARDGRLVTCLVSCVPVSLGRKRYLITSAQDITDQVHAEETRRLLEAQLHQSQKMESLGSLAGGVAHDLNNVLAAILGLSTAHRGRVHPPDPLARALDTITKACLRGREVIRGLLMFARRELEEERSVDLNAVILDLVGLLSQTTLKRVHLDTDLADALPEVLGDPGALSLAVMNLCLNSVDAMPDGGTITLATRRAPDGGVLLVQSDTGAGMPPEVLEKATEPFFTTKPTGQGSGLGLAMVYGTMRAHDGTLSLQSAVGRGTQALLSFPASRVVEVRPTTPSSEAEEKPSSLGLRVLLVDDDDLIRASVVPLVEFLGHDARAVSSGQEAIQLLEEGERFDLVLLDMNMPGMGGAETLPLILGERPDQAVVITTGYEDLKYHALKAAYPHVRSMSKPFTLGEMRTVLTETAAAPRPPA